MEKPVACYACSYIVTHFGMNSESNKPIFCDGSMLSDFLG